MKLSGVEVNSNNNLREKSYKRYKMKKITDMKLNIKTQSIYQLFLTSTVAAVKV